MGVCFRGFASLLAAAAWTAGQPLCEPARSDDFAERARVALRAGDAGAASTLFGEAFGACTANRNLLLELSRALTAARRFGEAVEQANKFLAEAPDSVSGLLVLANALFMGQRWEEARPVLERALQLEPTNPVGLMLKANNEYLLGENGVAEQTLLAVLDRHPENVEAAYMLGRIFYMTNRAEYAMGQFQRVLKLDPKHYRAWDNLGLCYDALGNADMAIRHFLTAIKLVETDHPAYDWAYGNLADTLLRHNRTQEAYQAATKAAQRNPYSARNFFLGGQALVKLERQQDALKWLERATTLDPDYPDALYALGQLYLRLGDKEKATATLKHFREAKAKAPKKRR